GAMLGWVVSHAANWLSLSQINGTLAGGEATSVIASLNTNANSLPPGTYTHTISFSNLTNGLGNTNLTVSLTLPVHPPVLLSSPSLLHGSNLQFTMTIQGLPSNNYVIQFSANLSVWSDIFTNLTTPSGSFTFTSPYPNNLGKAFYRA